MAQEDLILLEEAPKKETELEIVPDFDAARPDTSRRLEPSTTDYTAPDLAPHLELVPIPGEERSESDDDLFRRIEGEITYRPTDAELDKFLKYKSRQPKYAIDLIKGAWHGGKAVVTDLAKGVWGAIKDPELAFSPVPKGQARRVTTLAEGAARATWDLGTVGRYINDWFGEQRDLEYQEEIDDMKLRQSNPDWQSKTRRWKASTKEQKEAMRKSWSTFYIKKRIKEDLEDLEGTTNNFKDPKADLKRDFGRMGLVFVDGEDKGFYTSSKYINEVLPAKQREKYYKEFPKWINKRQRDRWRRGRYLMRTTELARRGEQTILGELFGPKVDEAAKALVNSDVATLASYAGGPGEVGAVLSTKLARKAATKPGRAVGRTTELAGKGTKWAGEKVQQIGEWATSSPEKSAALGAALGAAAGQDIPTIAKGIFGGLVEQKVRTIPTAGRVLQKAGTAIEAVGEVLTKPEGVEGLLKASSRVAKDESVADAFNRLSWLDPAINFAGDLGKGTATGGAFGLALTLPSGDPEVIGSGLGAGATGGFFATIPGRYLTRGAKLKEQLRNEWGQFQKELTPEQLNNIKEYAPTLEEMGNVMATVKMLNGVTRGGGNMDFKFLSPTDFIKAHGVQRGVVVTKNKTRPSVEINVGFKGPNALFHEGWHALKRFAGETELQKTPEGKKEVEVLKPYLDQIQTILFGKRLGGKTVTEGMFSEKDLVGGFYDQYTSKMAPEELTAFERQFKYDESGKELTPAEAKQRKLNYMMEEVEAESFRYLMSNADPRQIAQGDRSLHQRFTDHMLLSEHSKTLRGMRKALEVVGVNFKPTGQPSDIFVQKGQGITNTRELNAALRQYMRAWEGMQYRTRMMGELEPSGFSIGGTGKTGRAQVEFHLGKKENQFLRDHFSSSDMLKKNKDGGVYYDPDGRVVLLTEGEIRKLRENRGELIREKLSETDDGTGMILKENGSFEGIPSPHQLDAIDRISDEIVTPNQKRIIRETADIMRNDPGAPIQFLYNAALGRGKMYSSSLSSTHRTAVPIGFHVSQAQNFYFTALDLGAYHKKISAWGDPTKKALHKGGHKLALWDKDVRAFEADLFKYLENHKYDRPGDTGLDPNPQKAEQKRNALNDFFNINKGDETVTEGNFNPVTAARRAIDPKTGRQKKRAYRGLENLLRSYRLDRVLDENFGKSMSYALGRAVPMKSGADFFQKQLKNLMPPGEDMVAVHNLSADNLKHSLKMGGIASPSMAILDIAKADFDRFGEITLVASKDLVDPKKGAKVFGSDAYSPRYPSITIEMPKETRGKIEEFLKPYQKLGGEDFRAASIYRLDGNLEDAGWKRAAENHSGFQAAFLKEKGLLPDLKAAAAKGPSGKAVVTYSPEYRASSGIMRAVEIAVRDPKVEGEFRKWIEDLPEREGWQFEEKIFRGFTPAGNRRYQPHTLDNVVKIMKRNIRGGEGFNYGVGSVRSKVSPQFKSVAQIKKNRGKLTDHRSMEQIKDEASREMNDLADAMEPHLKHKSLDGYLDLGVFSEHLQEAAERGVRSLRDYYDEGAPLEKITEFLHKLKDLPTGYFEAKIPRAVQLEEFSAAIIPSDLDPKLKKVLEERGLELREYDVEQAYPFDQSRRRTLQKQTEEAGLRFMPAPTFYSKAERAVEASQQKTMSVDQAVSLATKGIPKAEYEWSGVVDWLEGRKEDGEEGLAIWRPLKDDPDPKVRGVARAGLEADEAKAAGKVSKAELLEFLQNKGVKVEEVWRSGKDFGEVDVAIDPEKNPPEGGNWEIRGKGDYWTEGEYRLDAIATNREGGERFYEIYVDEDAGNVAVKTSRGSFLNVEEFAPINEQTINHAEIAIEADMRELYRGSVPEEAYGPTLFNPDEEGTQNWVMLPGDEKAKQSYGELVLTLPKERGKSSETFDLPSSHRFPEENILAHIRFTERVDADGKKMLFIEELQSDWSNTGRRSGWRQERPAKVQKEIVKLQDEKATLQQNFWKPYYALEWAPLDVRTKVDKAKTKAAMIASKKGNKFIKEIDRLDVRIDELQTKYPHEPAGVPDMPFKGDNRYGALALKRMIRWASDNGFDRLGWITGKDTAERYDLSKQVDNIYFREDRDPANNAPLGTYSVKADTVSGDQVDVGLNLSADELAGSVGKDVADKIVNYEPGTLPVTEITARTGKPGRPQKTYWSTLSGEDLKVGGEWATTLYDKVLPAQAKKIVKKKGAVGRTRLRQDYTPEDLKDNIKHKDLEEELKESEKELNRLELSRPERQNNPNWRTEGNRLHATESLETAISEMRGEILSLKRRIDRTVKSPEANYVDITPEVKALAQEGFSYFMPPGAGRGRAAAPAQPTAPTLPATPIMPRVKLTEEEKEDSRRLLNLLKEKGI